MTGSGPPPRSAPSAPWERTPWIDPRRTNPAQRPNQPQRPLRQAPPQAFPPRPLPHFQPPPNQQQRAQPVRIPPSRPGGPVTPPIPSAPAPASVLLEEKPARREAPDNSNSKLIASSGSIAIATLISRITGFFKQVLLLTVLGSAIASAYTVASVLPNMIAELVLGAVLTAIVVPVLVRAEMEDPDQGAAFVRRLFTAAVTLLAAAALLATAAAPILTQYVFLSKDGEVNPQLTTALSFLLLPAILFYGLTALLTAILNTRQDFKPGAWAPVLNNVVVLLVLGVYVAVPGDISLDPVSMGDPKLLVLGGGVTLGVIVQATSLIPAIRRNNISLRPLWGLDARLKQFGGMAIAIVVYVVISQFGYVFATRISSHFDAAGPAIYNNAWLLLQLPYGVLGVTVLTAIMPRLSRNAASDDTPAVVDDLSIATRLTMIALIPVVVLLTFAGTEVGEALYGYGNFAGDSSRLGFAVSCSAFTLIPYAVVLIHLRVFYAREKAWTPTWIILGITVVKVGLSALAPVVANDADDVVILLGVANGIGFFFGAIIGAILLRRSLGSLRLANVGKTVWIVLVAALVGAGVMRGIDWLLRFDRLTEGLGGVGSLLRVGIGGLLMLAVTFTILRIANVPEIVAITVALRRRLGGTRVIEPEPEPAYDPMMDAQTMVIPTIRVDAVDITGVGEFPYPVRQRTGGRPHVGPAGPAWGQTREGVRMGDDSIAGKPVGSTAADTSKPTVSGIGAGGVSTDTVTSNTKPADETVRFSKAPTSPDRAEPAAPPRPPVDGSAASGPTPSSSQPSDATTPVRPRQLPHDADGPIPGQPRPPRPGFDDPTVRRAPRGPKLVPGASVAGGRYRLLAAHGGSRGLTFWQALDTKLDREVALTFVDSEQAADPTSTLDEGPQAILSRTLRLGRINSPGLARVLDVVRGSSGGIVVAEWTPGRSLAEMAETTPSPIGAARAIRALASAAELTHRSGGALSIDHPDRVRISVAGDAVLAFPGTLADADAQSDVRGLGAMLYALITARWPLAGATPGGVSGTAIPVAKVGGLLPATRGADGAPIEPREVRPEVPFEISAVAVRALETNRGVRTAATVQHVLDQASVVDQKTDLMPALRLGQRAPGSSGHSLADPEELAAEQARSKRTMLMIAGLGAVVIILLATAGALLANKLTGSGDEGFTVPGFTSAPAAPSGATDAPAPGGIVVPASAVAEFSLPGQGTPDSPEAAKLVLDGNPNTVWESDQYSEPFPKLKSGIGMLVTLPEPTKLSEVAINSPSPGTVVEIRSSPSTNPTLDQTQEIGSATLGPGITQIPVTSDQPVRYVLVWITKLAEKGNQNQSTIADLIFTAPR
ncbi:peptidoglycan biosynthesis protein MviN [Antrihabitans sp. YC3-6]|uniref:Peptidoglycan biosynthesis protein MviN n=1 Tax=Antrihabitans stalagmiti TaxID=2799499 RepID=A0A934NWJ9_9NOCA|nr:lipid II flippase MurJ [Antrihabitans stalagmiti]MBJ8342574.1 peptidoglycan biosynthesis protein MviN [Antrihabitans stalagmiti]